MKTTKGRGQRRNRRNAESMRRHHRIVALQGDWCVVRGWPAVGLFSTRVREVCA